VIAFALDYPTLDEARRGATRVREALGMIKVGLELFVEHGPAAVALGKDVGLPVFLDLKLHDIPETVERAVARACHLGAKLLTVHASGGEAMLGRAVERAKAEGTGLDVVAVTVLTSLDAADLAKMGVADDVSAHAERLARAAYGAGVRHFVCSPHEVARMRASFADATLITPGIRLASPAKGDDQKRVATAERAVLDGADILVVGRPIRDAPDPLAAAKRIAREAADAKAKRAAKAPAG
jgi:orotidine-5'-phosphate decarboxylase